MDVEEFIQEADLVAKIRQAIEAGQADQGRRELEIYISWKEPGEKSRGLGKIRFRSEDTDPVKLRARIGSILTEDLGDDPAGQVRLYFRFFGASEDTITTLQRTLGSSAAGNGEGAPPPWAMKLIYRQQDAMLTLFQATQGILTGAGEAMKGSADVIKAQNPQPETWIQLASALAPAFLGNRQSSAQPQQANQRPDKPVPGVEYANQRTGAVVKMDESGRWYEQTKDGGWRSIPPPADFPGVADQAAPSGALPAPEGDNDDDDDDDDDETAGGVRVNLSDPNSRRRLLLMIKREAADMGVTDEDQIAALIASQLRGVKDEG